MSVVCAWFEYSCCHFGSLAAPYELRVGVPTDWMGLESPAFSQLTLARVRARRALRRVWPSVPSLSRDAHTQAGKDVDETVEQT